MHEERASRQKDNDTVPKGAIPPYLLDREGESRAKVLSNTIKQKRKEKAGKWSVPLPQVKGVAEDEVFKVLTTGKKRSTCRAAPPGRIGCQRRSKKLTPTRAALAVAAARTLDSQAVEAHGHQGHLCRRRFHAQGRSDPAQSGVASWPKPC